MRYLLGFLSGVATACVAYLTKIGQLGVGEFALLDAEEIGITVSEVLQWCSIVEPHTLRPVAVYSGAYIAAGSIWTDPRVRTSPYGPRPVVSALSARAVSLERSPVSPPTQPAAAHQTGRRLRTRRGQSAC